MKYYICLVFVSVLSFSATASESPYAGQEKRNVKSLSQKEVDGLLKGKGLGYAKVAELNRYPGPAHVLDLAKELSLTENQIMKTEALFDEMEGQAIVLGKQIIEKELELDQLFSGGSVNSTSLKSVLTDIGALQAQIRYAHLSAHLKQNQLLTDHQVYRYNQLRGYGNSGGREQQHNH